MAYHLAHTLAKRVGIDAACLQIEEEVALTIDPHIIIGVNTERSETAKRLFGILVEDDAAHVEIDVLNHTLCYPYLMMFSLYI